MTYVSWGARRGGTAALLFAMTLVGGCKIDTEGVEKLNDPDELERLGEQIVDEARDLEVCPGYTLEELFQANSLSDECRDSLLSFLPEPETSFEGRLVATGGARVDGGTVHVLLQGADAEGAAIAAADLTGSLEVSLTLADGARALDATEYEVVAAADLDTDLVSVAVVNDYSASMLDGDLDDVEALQRALFECLPPVHETEVLRFSAEVQTALEFSSDAAAIDEALGPDPDFDRDTTALFDAIGTAVEDLSGRTRPVKILILSTDGGENSSMSFEEADVLSGLADEGIFVVAMGSLLADLDFMKTITRDRGVYFYTREFNALAEAAGPYTASLKELIELQVPMIDGAESIEIRSGDLELSLSLTLTGS